MAATSIVRPNIYIQDVPKFGDVSISRAAGISVAIASVVSDLVHDFVLPHVPLLDGKLSTPVGAAVAVASSAAATAGCFYSVNPAVVAELGIMDIAVVAGASEMGGEYLFRNFAQPFLAACC